MRATITHQVVILHMRAFGYGIGHIVRSRRVSVSRQASGLFAAVFLVYVVDL